ncbi:hypothetical protein [Limosilactobacillus oris]|uniref:hypothetical protein n=1 Tax=Limosilactobacillus oris TaxID=1632 RepID=UPI0024B32A1B|nr:hypothetical protein [Limosilactobacillus oris]WHO86452.1 hypothetical protein QLX69_04425 [Limosilactobacillus oris]
MSYEIKTPIDVACFIRDCIKGADPELAHENEDELYQKVLEEVVKGNTLAPKMAELALKTKQLDFPRWCA